MLNYRYIIFFACLLISFIAAILTPGNKDIFTSILVINLFSLLLYAMLLGLIRQFIYDNASKQKHNYKHLIILLPTVTGVTFGILLVRDLLLPLFVNNYQKIKPESLLYISVIFSVFIVTCFEGIEFFRHWKKYIIHAEQVEKANILAQYETLRSQINPHFLFNGLNTLISFIENKDDRAADFAQSMSDFLKYLLTQHKEDLITLEKELSTVDNYIFLQSARFDKNLVIKTDIKTRHMNLFVPPLALQMLVENAIKHNKISDKHKLKIDIYVRNDYLFVKNNIQLKNDINSARIGLENIKGRYQLFTDKNVLIEENSEFYLTGIPLLVKSTK